MERIIILGCGGGGKSTLAVALGEKLEIPVIHLDRLWWRPGWQTASAEEFDARLEVLCRGEKWVMDGNFSRTIPMRLTGVDTVVYLDLPRWQCLWAVLRRTLRYWGRSRPDMSEGCPERLDLEFIRWVWKFRRREEPKVMMALDRAGVTPIILKSRRACRIFLDSIPTRRTY